MSTSRNGAWKWFLLVIGLATAHFVIVMFVDGWFSGPQTSVRPWRPSYQPPWLYYAFIFVFAFPATIIFRIVRPGPEDGLFAGAVLIPTFLMWGCIWAEPFRRHYRWQPWRFSVKDLIIVTTGVGILLAIVIWLGS
jgi:hypothetical protein